MATKLNVCWLRRLQSMVYSPLCNLCLLDCLLAVPLLALLLCLTEKVPDQRTCRPSSVVIDQEYQTVYIRLLDQRNSSALHSHLSHYLPHPLASQRDHRRHRQAMVGLRILCRLVSTAHRHPHRLSHRLGPLRLLDLPHPPALVRQLVEVYLCPQAFSSSPHTAAQDEQSRPDVDLSCSLPRLMRHMRSFISWAMAGETYSCGKPVLCFTKIDSIPTAEFLGYRST